MSEHTPKAAHGGKRAGAGRRPQYGVPKVLKSVRLPPDWIAQLEQDFGSFQQAVEQLVQDYVESQD